MKKYISYKYDKNSLYSVKMRYEFYKDSEKKNCYIYFNNWQDFLIYYKNVDIKNRHFYEMFNDKIKFFLDIDCEDSYEDKQWNDIVNRIKNKLLLFINNTINVEKTKIIRCDSMFFMDENKRSCHLIIENFNFETKYCRELYNLFINQVEEDIKKYIDNHSDNLDYKNMNFVLIPEIISNMNNENLEIKEKANTIIQDNINQIKSLLEKAEDRLKEECYIEMYKKLNKTY